MFGAQRGESFVHGDFRELVAAFYAFVEPSVELHERHAVAEHRFAHAAEFAGIFRHAHFRHDGGDVVLDGGAQAEARHDGVVEEHGSGVVHERVVGEDVGRGFGIRVYFHVCFGKSLAYFGGETLFLGKEVGFFCCEVYPKVGEEHGIAFHVTSA